MVETLPMLEVDPRPPYRVSRVLRVLVFSLVLSLVIVSVLIVVFRFVWDNYVSSFLRGEPYNAEPLLIVPAMLVVAGFLAKILWDASEPGAPKLRSR